MPLVNTKEMFKKAYEGGYAVGAFNVNNMEIVQGITEACQELNAPVILQVSAGARKYANHTYLVKLIEAAVKVNPDIPIALHLDHGASFEICKDCIDGGFTSVMYDGSSKPYEENVEEARRVAEYAHKYNVTVEAELGKLGDAKGVPEEMLRKAAKSGVCKINIDSDIRLAMTATIRKYMAEHPEAFDPRAYLKPAREAVKDMVQRKIRNVLGSSNKI